MWIIVVENGFIARSPHGERGLKLREYDNRGLCKIRSPHGERGLKS